MPPSACEDVAVDVDRALAERLEVDDAAQSSGRSGAGSRPCGRRGGPWRRRAACGRRSTRGASRTRRSASRGPCRPSSAARTPATDAVQITRVSPQEISAEPVAVRTKSGLDRHRPQLVGRAAAAALAAHAAALCARDRRARPGPSGICRKRVPSARERLDVAGQRKRVVALAAGRVAEPARAEHVLDLAGERRAGGDDLDPAAEHALEHRADERVVGAAEDHGVDAGLAQRRAVGAHGVDDPLVEREAALDDRRQVRAGDRGDVDERVGVARSRARTRRSRPSPAWRAARRGRCASPPPPAPRRAARRRARRRPSVVSISRARSAGSAAAVAELQATTSSLIRRAISSSATSSANASSSAWLRSPYGKRAASAR